MSSFAASSRVAASAVTTRRVAAKPKRVRATRVVTRASGDDDKADKPDGMIDRDDLDGEYYKGFVSSGIGPPGLPPSGKSTGVAASFARAGFFTGIFTTEILSCGGWQSG